MTEAEAAPSVPQLSIILPTYRFDTMARQAIMAVAAAGNAHIQVLIGDNSENPAKWRFLEHVKQTSINVEVFCHPTNLGANGNYLFLLERSTGQFQCMAGDDDVMTSDFFQGGLDLIANDPAASVTSGSIIVVTPRADGLADDISYPDERLESTGLERIAAYYGKLNVLAYSIASRASLMSDAQYVKDNPLRTSFLDGVLAYSKLSQGKYRINKARPVYAYRNDNWSSAEISWQTSASFYVKCGVPAEFQHFHLLAFAIAILHYFHSRYRGANVTDDEGVAIAEYVYERALTGVRDDYTAKRDVYDTVLGASPAGGMAFAKLLSTSGLSVNTRFDQFCDILRVFSPAMADQYAEFLKTTLIGAKPDIQNPVVAPVDLAVENKLLREQISAVRSSTSWKLTAPLRQFALMLRGKA